MSSAWSCGRSSYEEYSPYAKDGGGWTAWAGDENYYDPHTIRIGLSGRNNPSYSNDYIEDIDMRLCVQMTDDPTNSSGNTDGDGEVQCTPWISESGGWSSYAMSEFVDWDAWRVQLNVQSSPGIVSVLTIFQCLHFIII